MQCKGLCRIHMNILVTGAQGYIARHLLGWLRQSGHTHLFGLDRNPARSTDAAIRLFQGDLLHPGLPDLLNEIQPDVVFHTAAAGRNASLAEQLKVNVTGTEYLLQSLLDIQVNARVVILGSAAEYGLSDTPLSETSLLRPEGEYGIAKAAQTQVAQLFARRHQMSVVVGRIFNVYGHTPATLAVAALASQVARQKVQGIAVSANQN